MAKRSSSRNRRNGTVAVDPVDDKYLTTREAGKLCGVSLYTIQRWYDEGLLSGPRMPSGRRRISLSSLNQFMREHKITPTNVGHPHLHRVLVVDDEPRVLDGMVDALSSQKKYLVRGTRSGIQAGVMLSDFRPDTVVLDIMLEDVPGEEAVGYVRNSEVGRGIRIVAISGKSSPADVRSVLKAGANAYLKKPFGIQDLMRAIDRSRTYVKR